MNYMTHLVTYCILLVRFFSYIFFGSMLLFGFDWNNETEVFDDGVFMVGKKVLADRGKAFSNQ